MRYRTPLGIVAALSTASALALTVQSPAQPASAAAAVAPFSQPYSTSASGEVLHVNALSLVGFPGVADVGLGISTGTTSGAPAHAATAEARNLDVGLLGGAPASVLASAKQTAPPDNPTPTSQTSIPADLSPLLKLDVSTATAQARTPAATDTCRPGSGALSFSSVNTAQLDLLETSPVGSLLTLPGTAKTSQASALVPNSATAEGGRDVVAAVSGSLADVRLFEGQVRISVAEAPTLKATATGKAGGAKVDWDAPLLKITAGGTEYTLPVDGSPLNIVVPGSVLGLKLQLGQLENVVTSADGTTAAGTASVLNVDVTLLGITVVDLDLFPFEVSAKSPAGGVTCGPSGPAGPDSDGDGLTDVQENTITHTIPTNPDSDGDGINDGAEDPDTDGLTNLEEVNGTKNPFGKAPTDPNDPDSDDGGVWDGVEVGRGTDPNNKADDKPAPPPADGDGDGLTDVQENTLTNTDPADADSDNDGVNDGAEDPDGDGLSNLEEVNGTENDLYKNEPTNPRNPDTDGDGLSDSEEIYETGTNPNVRDTDGDGTEDGLEDPDADGLNNEQETSGSENDAHGNEPTDPRDADSDNGGVKDGAEVDAGTDPNDGSDDKPAPSGPSIMCKNNAPTILGTPGDDVLTGTPGRDVINGRAGNDKIRGLGGNDILCGRNGDDIISSGSGNDFVLGGLDDDRVSGGAGNDRLGGRNGDDRMSGGPGNDGLLGGRGDDALSGNAGVDRLGGNQGNDTLSGGPGRDQLIGGPGRDSVRQ